VENIAKNVRPDGAGTPFARGYAEQKRGRQRRIRRPNKRNKKGL